MKFVERESVPHIDKEHGTSTWYYIFPEHEVHYNEIKPQASQQWHHHLKTDENIFVIEGTIRISWLDEDGNVAIRDVEPETLIRIEDSVHTVSNPAKKPAKFLAFKFVPRGKDLHEVIKNDKVLDQVTE